MTEPTRVAAVDVGGTLMKGAVTDGIGRVRYRRRVATPRTAGSEAVIARLLELVDDLLASADEPVAAVGVAVPGLIDDRRGVAVRAANLGWRDLPVAARVSDHVGRPAVLGHDVRCGALAEARVGAGREASSLLFVPIGTGIGGGLVVDGHVLTGAHLAATEIGHLVVDPDGPDCGCGRRGCLETVASASAVARAYASRTGAAPGSVTAAEVAQRVIDGDAHAQHVWARASSAIGRAIGAACTLLDPGMVVLGGGLARAGALLLDPVRVAVDSYRSLEAPVPIVTGELGDEAGCVGAALLAADRLRDAGTATGTMTGGSS